jgi:hypothetical protein
MKNEQREFNCTKCGGRLSAAFVQWFEASNRAAHLSPMLCNKCCPRAVAEGIFLTRSGATSAINELHAAGYDVLVGDHLADEHSSETVFVEIFGRLNRENADVEALASTAGAVSSDVNIFWQDIQRIIDPFGGEANSCGLVNDEHVPFFLFR